LRHFTATQHFGRFQTEADIKPDLSALLRRIGILVDPTGVPGCLTLPRIRWPQFGAVPPTSRSCRIYYAGNHRMPDQAETWRTRQSNPQYICK
jgi:hypothetical protein